MAYFKERQLIQIDDESEIAQGKLENPKDLGPRQVLEVLGGGSPSLVNRLRKTTASVRMPRAKENLT